MLYRNALNYDLMKPFSCLGTSRTSVCRWDDIKWCCWWWCVVSSAAMAPKFLKSQLHVEMMRRDGQERRHRTYRLNWIELVFEDTLLRIIEYRCAHYSNSSSYSTGMLSMAFGSSASPLHCSVLAKLSACTSGILSIWTELCELRLDSSIDFHLFLEAKWWRDFLLPEN